MNVMHGEMIVNYNTAFDNSNLCALNYVQYLNITDNIDLIENAVLFKNFTLFEYMFFFTRFLFEMENNVHSFMKNIFF